MISDSEFKLICFHDYVEVSVGRDTFQLLLVVFTEVVLVALVMKNAVNIIPSQTYIKTKHILYIY